MKVKCIVAEYYDKELDKYVKQGDIIEIKPERGKYLVFKGIVEPFIKENTNEVKAVTNK
ncbi:MAG: hypothetical protein RSF92_11260 [Niameybacter sp.]|uniref:hypothetical protein n=1 Tax=Niameybacter sp. TaxID=2033640 RepID=UPI002FC85B1C